MECRLSEADLKAALELAKIGYVRIFTSQISVRADSESGLKFKEYGSNKEGFSVPSNWVIEWAGCYDGRASFTFGLRDTENEK